MDAVERAFRRWSFLGGAIIYALTAAYTWGVYSQRMQGVEGAVNRLETQVQNLEMEMIKHGNQHAESH